MGVGTRERTHHNSTLDGLTHNQHDKNQRFNLRDRKRHGDKKPPKKIIASYVSPNKSDPRDPKDPTKIHPALTEKHGRKYLMGLVKHVVPIGSGDTYAKQRKNNESIILGSGPIVSASPEVVAENMRRHDNNFEFALSSVQVHTRARRKALLLGATIATATTSLLGNFPLHGHTAAATIGENIPGAKGMPVIGSYIISGLPSSHSSKRPTIFSTPTPSLPTPNSLPGDTTPSTTAAAPAAVAPNLAASPGVFTFGIRAEVTEFQFPSNGKTDKATCAAVGGLARKASEGLVDPDATTINAIHRAESAPGVVNIPGDIATNIDFQNGVYNSLFKPHKAPYDNPAHYANKAGSELDVPIDCTISLVG